MKHTNYPQEKDEAITFIICVIELKLNTDWCHCTWFNFNHWRRKIRRIVGDTRKSSIWPLHVSQILSERFQDGIDSLGCYSFGLNNYYRQINTAQMYRRMMHGFRCLLGHLAFKLMPHSTWTLLQESWCNPPSSHRIWQCNLSSSGILHTNNVSCTRQFSVGKHMFCWNSKVSYRTLWGFMSYKCSDPMPDPCRGKTSAPHR